ncbi:hypothetical protein ATCV1_z857R [Acanthocystis turfacea chlorella virus 1]|uniref:Uncharacterized protein z857R n=1 Tax=Chlorovirus heliozoae TaxID=322019 RepID=A7KAB7_9PHYC|nr:hypothetical protein ATCV1_z857R [Acanthocystis turfacea chlorella virus 1]ABT16991.1 hypothetical protein ATCV1_z857R [Acanthocystis turfacea chlorella virus 1]
MRTAHWISSRLLPLPSHSPRPKLMRNTVCRCLRAPGTLPVSVCCTTVNSRRSARTGTRSSLTLTRPSAKRSTACT